MSHNARRNGQWMLYGKGVIPYVISGTFTREQKLAIRIAMKEYQDKTCIRFVKKRRKHKYFVDIINNKKAGKDREKSGNCMHKRGCWSSVGYVEQDCNNDPTKHTGQKLNLDSNCFSRRGKPPKPGT